MQTPSHMHRMALVILPSGEHTQVALDTLVALAHDAGLSIEYPPPGGPGWATTRLGSHRLAAWFVPDESAVVGVSL